MPIKNIIALIVSLVICQLAGLAGSLFTSSSVNGWYLTLNRPAWTPSGRIIGSVWVILFILMGVSLYFLWQNRGENKTVLILFFTQLFFNILWSFCFFYLQSPLLAFAEIIILWLLILLTIIFAFKSFLPAGWLLIPYILWVSFAAYLNFAIWRMNI